MKDVALSLRRSRLYALILLSTVAATIFLIYLNTPPSADDLYFANLIGATPDANEYTFSFPIEGWTQMAASDQNVRLANLLIPLFLWAPRWIFAALMTAALIGIIVGAVRLAGGRWHSSPLTLTFITSAMILAWPWFEWMFTIAYGLNYVLSGLLLVWYLQLFISDRTPWWGAVLTALLAGAIHEGVAASLLAASVWMLLVNRRMRTPRRIVMTLLLIPGLTWIFSAAANRQRMDSDFSRGLAYYRRAMLPVAFAPLFLWTAIEIVACIASRSLRRLKEFATGPAAMLYVVSCATMVLYLTFPIGYRQGAWAVVMGAVGIVLSVRSIPQCRRMASGMAMRIAMYVVGAVTCLHLLLSAALSMALPAAWHSVIDAYRRTPESDMMVVAVPDRHFAPPGVMALTLNKVWFCNMYRGNNTMTWILPLYCPDKQLHRMEILPESAVSGSERFARPLPGHPGVYFSRSWLLADEGTTLPSEVRLKMGPLTRTVYFARIDFIDADGRHLQLGMPLNSQFLIDTFGISPAEE